MRHLFALFSFALASAAPVAAAEVVPVPAFSSIQLRGGGSATVRPGPVQRVTLVAGDSQVTDISVSHRGELIIDACRSQCPRGYQLSVVVEIPTVPPIAIAGGGRIVTASGFRPQPSLAAAVKGGGQIDARTVDAIDVSAAISGGGEIRVRPRNSLAGAVKGGGLIRYDGNPSVARVVSGGGAIVQSR